MTSQLDRYFEYRNINVEFSILEGITLSFRSPKKTLFDLDNFGTSLSFTDVI